MRHIRPGFIPLLLAACTNTSVTPKASPELTDSGTRHGETSWVPDTDDSGTTDSGTTDTDIPTDTADTGTSPVGDIERCFGDQSGGEFQQHPDYAQYNPVVASHCLGTNHQDIKEVERVVFVGDSVTVGSPPTDTADWYRNVLAGELSTRWGLDAPGWSWQNVDIFDGVSYDQLDGDFGNCAKWGARTDDLIRDNDQLVDCLPEDQRHKNTLVVMTSGGNDVHSMVKNYMEGATKKELWEQTEEFVGLLRDAVTWLKTDDSFTGEVYVVFGNLYDYTDGTGDLGACDGADLIGYEDALADPDMIEMLSWAQEQYLSVAVETGADMMFMSEAFCGHGFNSDNPDSPCHTGKKQEVWFDFTCIHPNANGHAALADIVTAVIDE